MAEATPPPAAPRHLAMMHAAMYDAVNAVYRTHTPYKANLTAPAGTSAEAAAAVAAHRVLADLYPRRLQRLDASLDASLEGLPEAGKNEGMRLGQAVAEAMLTWRSTDGSTRTSSYKPVNAPGRWQPTPPEYRPALLPEWRSMTPFAMKEVTQFTPQDPP